MGGPVLIVEDDPAIRHVLQLVLEGQGCTVALASDGLEALRQLDRELPDLILLDLMMPRMDGAAFLAELGSRGLRPGIPIIVLSASPGGDRWSAEVGAEGFLPKPFDVPALQEAVARVAATKALAPVF